MSDGSVGAVRWWGDFSFKEGDRGFWRVGQLSLAVSRSRQEWRVQRHSQVDAHMDECRVSLPSDESVSGDGVTEHRFTFGRTSETLSLTPRLADRPVVVSPESPFYVPANQEILLFCSTPMWLRLEVGKEKTVLEEFPMIRPPDTWFGSSTREGELCYATTTAARLRREDLRPRPHRALTELRIRNDAKDTLELEKVNLSVPLLSLYVTSEGAFWSDGVTLYRKADGTSELEIDEGRPEGVDSVLVSSARVVGTNKFMVRAFEVFFAKGEL